MENEKKKNIDRYKKVFWAVFSPLLAVLTVWAVLEQNKSVSIKDIIDTFSRTNKIWFTLAAICSFLFIVLEGVAICSILKGANYRPKPLNGLIYSTSDVYFSAITPSATGGQPASAYFMLRDGISAGVVTATLIVNLMMYTVSLVVLGIIAVIIHPHAFFGFSPLSKVLIISGAVVLGTLSFCFFFMLKNGNKVFSWLEKFLNFLKRKRIVHISERVFRKVNKTKKDYAECSKLLANNYSILLKSFLWTLLQRISQIIAPVLLHLSLGGNLRDSSLIFSKQCLITVGYNLIPIPGAMGVADYLMIDGFSEIMGRNAAFGLEMLSRGLTFYICVSVSGVITLVGYIIKRKKKTITKQV
ncbi:MAG: flippase-like domain-containing protein [Clostridia bacterium]|nr:flippase-like domain-containing protein [Clostridia bacterium]